MQTQSPHTKLSYKR